MILPVFKIQFLYKYRIMAVVKSINSYVSYRLLIGLKAGALGSIVLLREDVSLNLAEC